MTCGARLSVLLSLLPPLAAGIGAPLCGQGGQLGGVVLEEDSGRPVSDAQLRLFGTARSVVSDRDGRYRILLAPGIYTEMHGAPGRAPVDDFEAGELDDAVTLLRIEACGFGIEDNFAHGIS